VTRLHLSAIQRASLTPLARSLSTTPSAQSSSAPGSNVLKRGRAQTVDSESQGSASSDDEPAGKQVKTGSSSRAPARKAAGQRKRSARPKARDFEDEVEPLILRACFPYEARILTTSPFPDKTSRTTYAKLGWKEACEAVGEDVELTPELTKVASPSFPLFL
jgi:hypothetical protein